MWLALESVAWSLKGTRLDRFSTWLYDWLGEHAG